MISKKKKLVKSKSNSKILAAKVLVEQTKGAKALSHREKRVATQLLAGVRDQDGVRIPRDEVSDTASRPHVRDVIVEALTTIGVTPDKLARVLADGLDAKEVKFFQHEGMVTDAREVVDHGIRHRYLETALTLVGAGSREARTAGPSNVFIFKSFLGEKPQEIKIGAPTDAIVSRRLAAAKIKNRSSK